MQPTTPTKRTCVFCGGQPTTREHIFSPKWVADLTSTQEAYTGDFFRQAEDGTVQREQWANRDGAGGVVRCACATCNNGWMQELDTAAREAVTPLARGEAGTVSANGVRLVSTWAAKIAIVMDSMWGPEILDRALKESFRKTLEPPETWTVWATAMNPTRPRTRLRGVTLTAEAEADVPQAYFASFSVLHLIVQVFCPLIDGVVFRRSDGYERHTVRLWPSPPRLRWPPPDEVALSTEKEFTALTLAVVAARP